MENASIILIEANAEHRDIVRRMLAYHKHEVVAEASTTDSGKELIAKLSMGRLACDAIVLDGNLSPDSYGCRDAKRILSLYNDHGLTQPIIAYSNSYFCENDISIPEHHDIGKNPPRLLAIIASL